MNRNIALILLVVTAILWSIGGVLIKSIPFHALSIVSGRSFFSLFIIIPFTISSFKKRKLRLSDTVSSLSERKKSISTLPLLRLKSRSSLISSLSLISRPTMIIIVSGSICMCLLSTLFITATQLTTAANAIVLQFSAPIWVVILSFVFLKQRPKRIDLFGIFFVIIGISLFFADGLGRGNLLGDFVAVCSGVAMASLVLLLKSTRITMPIFIILFGNLLSFIIGLPSLIQETFTYEVILLLAIAGIFQIGLSYIIYNIAIREVTSLEGVFVTILEPLLNPLWVFIFTGETIGSLALVGAFLVLLTVIIHSYFSATKQSSTEIVNHEFLQSLED